MSLFFGEHHVGMLDPNCPKHIATKEVPNLNFNYEVLKSILPKERLFPMETIMFECPNPTNIFCIMKVIHRHALWAWMHAKNLCLID